jgi:hypothetical protein
MQVDQSGIILALCTPNKKSRFNQKKTAVKKVADKPLTKTSLNKFGPRN